MDVSVIGALREYFGLLPNQSISDFAKELKSLTESDRLELATDCAVALGKTLVVKS